MNTPVRGKRIFLVIPCYERANYLLRCTDSLYNLATDPTGIIFVNDASRDPEVDNLIDHFEGTCKISHEKNTGVRGCIKDGADNAFGIHEANLVVVLDSDAIVKPNFVDRIVGMYHKYGNITSGFNAHNIKNPIEETGDGCVFKKHVNGINVCFNREQYEKYVAPALEIGGNWDYNTSLNYQKDNKLFTITAPSVVQHIGLVSSMGHTNNGVKPDIAYDFD